MSTIGYGDIVPSTTGERLLSCVVMVVGSCVYAYGITSVSATSQLHFLRPPVVCVSERVLGCVWHADALHAFVAACTCGQTIAPNCHRLPSRAV